MEKAAEFAGKIRDVHAGKKFVYNLSPSFNWMGHGFTEESLKSFIWDLTKHGSVQSLCSSLCFIDSIPQADSFPGLCCN